MLSVNRPAPSAPNPCIDCRRCALFPICLPKNMDDQALAELDQIIVRHRPMAKGAEWLQHGQPFRSIFAVRSGCMKTYRINSTGQEQVSGFHLPGELIGLDAIDAGSYGTSARVLKECSVCEIPFARFEQLSEHHSVLRRELVKLMSQEIVQQRWHAAILNKQCAEARLAGFLLNLHDRLQRRGYGHESMLLSMSRYDIGNYLGLTVETVSRSFTRLRREGLLQVQGKQVHLMDLERLRALAAEGLPH